MTRYRFDVIAAKRRLKNNPLKVSKKKAMSLCAVAEVSRRVWLSLYRQAKPDETSRGDGSAT
jgi:hypothetical protein